jgi:predicted DCC family thiol-disulfide oxidoreductase YuxK
MDSRKVTLVYDKECPVCDAYCRRVQVTPEWGTLELVDARLPGSVMREITDRGWDIDQGMVLKKGDQLYYGQDAIHQLALLSPRAGLFNRLNFQAFRSTNAARLLYPVLRNARNLLLKLLGKTKINNLGRPGNERF